MINLIGKFVNFFALSLSHAAASYGQLSRLIGVANTAFRWFRQISLRSQSVDGHEFGQYGENSEVCQQRRYAHNEGTRQCRHSHIHVWITKSRKGKRAKASTVLVHSMCANSFPVCVCCSGLRLRNEIDEFGSRALGYSGDKLCMHCENAIHGICSHLPRSVTIRWKCCHRLHQRRYEFVLCEIDCMQAFVWT